MPVKSEHVSTLDAYGLKGVKCSEQHTLLALVVLELLEGFERGSTGDELVGELALVLLTLTTVDLSVGVLGLSCGKVSGILLWEIESR